MNIFPIQNNNIDRKNVQFQGITRLLEKQIYRDGQREINAVIAQRTRNSLVAGQFPKSLMEKIPAELRAVAIPEIIKTFGIVSKAIREYQAPLLNAENFFSYTESDRHRPKFANDLLETSGIVVVPGTAFAADAQKYVRLSVVAPDKNLDEVIERMKKDGFEYNK